MHTLDERLALLKDGATENDLKVALKGLRRGSLAYKAVLAMWFVAADRCPTCGQKEPQ